MRQTNFLPSLLHEYLAFGVSKKDPAFLQVLPTLGAAALTFVKEVATNAVISAAAQMNFTAWLHIQPLPLAPILARPLPRKYRKRF